ncbi:MAG TPA: bifunctional homocysteine S-methyltransferase/methylenetetrahydrofolate reductase [Syntrophomonas sp.]|nr:bifunctional homocysteine S-methyltransferase/methylenetetrahydrofolate reductase [Syntrophomonas sp.]
MNITKTPFIFDGAMGTYYAAVSPNPLPKCELANLYERDTILAIHRQYIDAGCQAIRTNTFAANRISLETDFAAVAAVIKAGYEIAQEAVAGADADVKVFADIGPVPLAPTEDLWEEYRGIVNVFLELGADNFVFETFSSDEYLPEISRYIKSFNPQAYILTEFAVSPEGLTRQGDSGHKLIENVLQIPTIDACGFNCFSGPYHLLQYIKTFDTTGKTISIMPNSGYPTIINNRTFFEDTKEYFAARMLEIAKQGVTILGGCCGTTPEFIRETVARLGNLSSHDIVPGGRTVKAEPKQPAAGNALLDKMNRGQKVIAVELDPPVDTDIEFFMNSAKTLKEQGVDAITIADCPIARARVDSSLMACKLQREVGIIPIPHMTCRDRNINATKALLLGLNIEGVNNVLVVTGDPVPTAQRDEVKSIFNFNSVMLAKFVQTLNETVFDSPFTICGALNVNARYFTRQLEHAKKKISNGVSIFLTQPVLSEQAIENIELARAELPAKILGGIMPIISHRNACFVNNEISGIQVADEIIARYEGKDREEAGQLAVAISTEMAEKIYDFVDGYYLITPFKRIDILTEIIDNLKLMHR